MSKHPPIVTALLNSLAPFCCELCGLPSNRKLRLCQPCEAEIVPNRVCCRRCAIPLYSSAAYCGDCLQRPPAFQQAVVPRFYAAPVDQLVHAIKFKADVSLVPVLVELMAPAVREYLCTQTTPTALVPMPLHWRRHLRRGFNQAELLARQLCRHPQLRQWHLQVERRLCKRHRYTPPQQGLDRSTRLRNLDNAFSATRDLSGYHLVIVDDVMTTGTSVSALAQTLYRAGAAWVDVWCCARTPGPPDHKL